ncbi:MAG: hypothetical protein ACFFCS_27515 [Candidatus Hodarchaeota archaeon]
METNRIYIETFNEDCFIHLEGIPIEIKPSDDDPDYYLRITFGKSFIDVARDEICWLEYGDDGTNRKNEFFKLIMEDD